MDIMEKSTSGQMTQGKKTSNKTVDSYQGTS